jgi:hypothetical protein
MAKDPYPQIGLRVDDEFLKKLDDWRRKQDGLPGRPEAVRQLVELGLTVKRPTRPKSQKASKRAAELAANVIDRHIDAAAPPEERAERKLRILRGPSAFRVIRKDKAE